MDDVAIIGMACLFPGAPDLETFRRNVRDGVDAIRDVPSGRWDPAFYDPAARGADRFYCRRGGFVDELASFDAAAHGIMPVAAAAAEPDQLLALELATRALADAGLAARPFARERAGVILGRGNYAGAGRTRLELHVRAAEQLVRSLADLVPGVAPAELARVKAEFQAALAIGSPDAAIGLVPNLTASRIANRLDFGGPAFTVDAACASSLLAVDQACVELASRRCDVVLAGGVHLCHDEAFWSVFCQLGALSRVQHIRPFDRRADGLLIGEGIGVIVLKRRADAERDDDRVYAVIRGTGVASDGREQSLMNPRVDGQVLALRRAWDAAGVDPVTVGLVEAHGTATPTGDAAELATLRRVFGPAPVDGPRAVLGSVKSMIGHAMPAAGIAGVIKAALALHDRVLPPTLHCDEPHPAVAETRFRVIDRAEPWDAGTAPRRAAVNAFGFGGINAHVVLEEAAPAARRSTRPTAALPRVLVVAAADARALADLLDRASSAEPVTRVGAGPCRAVVLDPTPERLARARAIVAKGEAWNGKNGLWHSPRPLLAGGGRIAFAFPGVDSAFQPRVDDVAAHFRLPVPAGTSPASLEETGVGIVGVNRLLHRALGELGVRPDVLVGHSIGEWSGMLAAGMVAEDDGDAFIVAARPGSLDVPGVAFAAVGCGVDRAAAAIDGLPDIAVSHDNCPHQVILCGAEASIDEALARLRAAAVLGQKLPFRSGFHSRLFADFLGPHRDNFARLALHPARVPLFSATTCAEYPRDEAGVRALALAHLTQPVRFRELILALHDRGVRAFVQVGTGSLPGFIEDTLRGRPHVAVSANVPQRGGLEQLQRVLATLFVEGADAPFERLGPRRGARAGTPLRLGVPLVRLTRPLATVAAPAPAPAPAAHPVAAAFAASVDSLRRAQEDVLARFAAPARPRLGPREARVVRRLSVDAFPELADHTFFRQPPGWPVMSDRHPVVPMTMTIALMMDAAAALVPERTPIAVEDVRAFRWIAVGAPVDAELTLRFDGKDRVAVSVAGFAEGTVVVGEAYPEPPPPAAFALAGERPAPHDAARLYRDRWMFHGPAYQGVVDLGPMGDDGIRGVLEAGAAKGALLDNAGQLFGYWIMVTNVRDRMAMPVRIRRMRFFGPHPEPGARVGCRVAIRRHAEREVTADLEITRDGRVWAAIDEWEDRRFDTDDRFWDILQYPERHLLGEARPDGFVLFRDGYRAAPTREQLCRRYLGERERATYDAHGPRGQRAWLSARVAGKDAVRAHLWRGGVRDIFPVEVELASDPSGRPRVVAPAGRDLRISLAHKDDVAVALVAEGRDVGIDVERVEPRAPAFIESAFFPDEVAMAARGEDRDEWLTRLWVAKEAVGKARGTGLQGNPRRLRATDRTGERILVEGLWVETRRDGDHVIGWSYA